MSNYWVHLSISILFGVIVFLGTYGLFALTAWDWAWPLYTDIQSPADQGIPRFLWGAAGIVGGIAWYFAKRPRVFDHEHEYD